MKELLLASLVFLTIRISATSQTIPANRRTDWSVAGYRGNTSSLIPQLDVTQQGLIADAVTDNAPTLNNLISATAGNRRVLYFPAGTYRFNATIFLNDSVILRGAGADSTHFIFNFSGASGDGISGAGSANSVWIPVSGGYQRNSDRIIVQDSGLIQPGSHIEIRQQNGSWDTQPISWADYSVGQLLEVSGRNGDTVFLAHPLRTDYDSSLQVQVASFNPLKEALIECLSVERIDSVSCFCPTINFRHAVDCAIRGVEGRKSISAHLLLDGCSNITVSGSHFHDAFEYNGTSMHGYGIALINHTGQSLIENNILQHLRHSFSFQTGANGNVVAYNFSTDPNRSEFPANYGADISMHGHYPYANLFEGNIVQNIQLDQTWGPSGPLNTFFRNRAELYGILMSSGTVNSDSQNFVGNEVTSTAAFQGNYVLAGVGHFEYGNNVRGTITPAGTGNLNDISCYRTSLPDFWDIPQQWPGIGFPNAPGSGTIPAKERHLAGFSKTVCETQTSTAISSPVVIPVLQWFPNPIRCGETVRSMLPGQKNTRIEVTDMTGRVLLSEEATGPGLLELHTTGIPSGVYWIRARSGEQITGGRLLVTE